MFLVEKLSYKNRNYSFLWKWANKFSRGSNYYYVSVSWEKSLTLTASEEARWCADRSKIDTMSSTKTGLYLVIGSFFSLLGYSFTPTQESTLYRLQYSADTQLTIYIYSKNSISWRASPFKIIAPGLIADWHWPPDVPLVSLCNGKRMRKTDGPMFLGTREKMTAVISMEWQKRGNEIMWVKDCMLIMNSCI